ncbi:DsbA family protein [Enterococcus asini]|uniref:DsbA family protein n=1 Tax=Enterococcus asini TaxID=57732 RepID=UPI000E4BC370|nr:DsbA family protein [Enterococcus asini]RGW14457.1 DsbA family protein [Enterococcus asini]
MIEIYLFVNPIGSICLETETKLLDFIGNSDKKIQFRVIPLVNMQTIHQVMKRRGIDAKDIDARNKLFTDTYSAALDCKAVQLQGKKTGRKFMMRLQQAVACEQIPYSQELVCAIIDEVGADLEMFLEDRPSAFVKEMFQNDQDTARDMGITQHPSEVVYNFSSHRDYGVLLEGAACISDLPKLCQSDAYRLPLFQLASHVAKPKKQQL